MENENLEQNEMAVAEETKASPLHIVTSLSKHLAMTLFVALPFIGGWVGYTYAPEKIVETEKVVEKEVRETKTVYRTPNQQYFNVVEVEGWDKDFPVLSIRNDLYIPRSGASASVEGFDLSIDKIESIPIGDGFRYEKGNLINNEIVIHVDPAFAVFVIKEADSSTFRVIDGFLSRDVDTLFYRGRSIAGADPDKVEISNYVEAGIADNPDGLVIIGAEYAWVAPGCNFYSGANFTKVTIEDLPFLSRPCLTEVQREN